ncbi:MAG: glycoside hydrolase family 76 protein [Fimbriimonadaceae bacterium]
MVSLILGIALAQQTRLDFRSWGFEAIEAIQHDLIMRDGYLFGEDARPGARPTKVAFNWGVGVMLQALNAASRADRDYRPRLKRYVEATRAYWNQAGPVAGYEVLPGLKSADRYYDDNEWMVLALVEASGNLDSREILNYAKQTFRYVMSGADGQLGGGIYWRESKRTSKNTCSNGPAAAAALALYRTTHDKSYLAIAKRLYAWTRAHLQDPADGLYWDSISLSGHIGRDKWSYNTGLMLQDAAELYAATKGDEYAKDARRLQAASLKRWVGANGGIKDEGKFMFLLLDAWMTAFRDVPNVDDPRRAVISGLAYLHANCRDRLGHYGSRWDGFPPTKPYSPFTLINQAAAARAFLVAYHALKGPGHRHTL